MDINCLSVMNAIHKLGLTEKEIRRIGEEKKHRARTGFSIKAIKKDYVIGIDHDERHEIAIKKINKLLPKSVTKNKKLYEEITKQIKPNTRILFKTLITFDELPNEIYTLHEINAYNREDFKIKRVARDIEGLKVCVFERFTESNELLGERAYKKQFQGGENKREESKKKVLKLIKKQVEAICWLFGQEYKYEIQKTRTNIPTIIKVFEKNNRRLAVIQDISKCNVYKRCFYNARETDEVRDGLKVIIRSYNPQDERYNYVDEKRELYFYGYSKDEEIWICDELTGLLSETELGIITKNSKGLKLLTKKEYDRIKDSIRTEIMTAHRTGVEKQAEAELEKQLMEKFRKEKTITKNGISFTKKMLKDLQTGITLKGDLEGYIVGQVYGRETNNFNSLYKGFVYHTLRNWGDNNEIEYSIGEINIKGKDTNGTTTINNFKVRTDEVEGILNKAIEYKTQEEYDDFLKDVSRESLRIKKALKEGIKVKLIIDRSEENDLTENQDEIKLPLLLKIKKEENKYYLVMNGKDYRIKDTEALFQLPTENENYYSNWRNNNSQLQRTIKLFYKALEGITPNTMQDLIAEARKMQVILKQLEKEKIEKSKEFVKNAIRITNAIEIEEGEGWIVTGKSNKEYRIDEEGKVYDNKTNRYICITSNEEAEGEAGLNDKIAKRILILHNDYDVAKNIHTLELREEEDYEED